jgi:hypothetical protein
MEGKSMSSRANEMKSSPYIADAHAPSLFRPSAPSLSLSDPFLKGALQDGNHRSSYAVVGIGLSIFFIPCCCCCCCCCCSVVVVVVFASTTIAERPLPIDGHDDVIDLIGALKRLASGAGK